MVNGQEFKKAMVLTELAEVIKVMRVTEVIKAVALTQAELIKAMALT